MRNPNGRSLVRLHLATLLESRQHEKPFQHCFYLRRARRPHPAQEPPRSRDRGSTCPAGEPLHAWRDTSERTQVCTRCYLWTALTWGRPRATHSTLAALKLPVPPHVLPESTSAPQNTWLSPRKASSRCVLWPFHHSDFCAHCMPTPAHAARTSKYKLREESSLSPFEFSKERGLESSSLFECSGPWASAAPTIRSGGDHGGRCSHLLNHPFLLQGHLSSIQGNLKLTRAKCAIATA